VLGQARYRQRAGDRPKRDDESLELDLDPGRLGLHGHAPRTFVQRDSLAQEELCVRTHHAQGHDHVPRLERARSCLREDGRVEHEVLAAHDRGAPFAEQAPHVAAGEAAAEDEGSVACGARLDQSDLWPAP
jgi:hypothetical protein